MKPRSSGSFASTLFVVVLASASIALAAEPSMLDKLLRISGLTANPSQMRGAGDDIEGSVWIADLQRGAPSQLTHDDGAYRWPVFAPGGDGVFALTGDRLVRIALPGGQVTAVQTVKNAVKLVGFDKQDTDQMLLVLDNAAGASPFGLLSIKSGKLAALPYDPKSDEQRRMLNHVRGQERVYGGVGGSASVYIKTESKHGMAREIEWTDVYLKRGDAPPRDVSLCDGVNCAQPSLSADASKVVFVKAAP